MKLYILRHADAVDGADDAARPLSERGRRQIRALAVFLRPLKIKVQAIWHSGLVRAKQSADLIEPVIDSAKRIVRRDGLAPMDKPGAAAAGAIEAFNGDLMIVGHEPHLGKLVSKLLTGKGSADIVHLRKSSLVCLERDKTGHWRLEWQLSPDLIGD